MPKINPFREDFKRFCYSKLGSKVDLGVSRQRTKAGFERIRGWREHLMRKSGQPVLSRHLDVYQEPMESGLNTRDAKGTDVEMCPKPLELEDQGKMSFQVDKGKQNDFTQFFDRRFSNKGKTWYTHKKVVLCKRELTR
jgi:hypothetical protein